MNKEFGFVDALDVWLDDNSAAQKAVVQLEEKLDEKVTVYTCDSVCFDYAALLQTAQFESLKSYKLELEQQIVWMEDTVRLCSCRKGSWMC